MDLLPKTSSGTESYQNNDGIPHTHIQPPVAPMHVSTNLMSQIANDFHYNSSFHHLPSFATLTSNNPTITYMPRHYTPRNLRRDRFLQSNEYYRRRVEAVIKYSADFQLSQFGDVQEDDDLMYCFTSGPDGRLIQAWVEIFLTTPQCYLDIALEEVRVAFFEQTTRVPDAVQTHSGEIATSTGNWMKRKASMVKDNVQTHRIGVADKSDEVQVPEPHKRPRYEETSPTSEQLLSACSSSDLDSILDMFASESIAQYPTASYAATPYAPTPSGSNVPAAPAVATASQGQSIVPAAFLPVVVVNQPTLVDPIAAMMALHPNRNTVDTSGRGFKGVAMSHGQIRAHLEIEGRSLATLPASANSIARHEMRGVAPPRTVDPTLINCVTTAQEMLTFLPYQTVNYELWDRIRKSWAPKEVADFMAYVRQLQNPRSYHRTIFHHDHDDRPDDVPTHTFTTNVPSKMSTRGRMDKRGDSRPLHDYFLYHLGDGVVNYPAGSNAQLLTRCVQHVRNVSHDMNVRISEILQYAARHCIIVPPADLIQPDTNVVQNDTPSRRFLDLIDSDFVRRHGRRSGTV